MPAIARFCPECGAAAPPAALTTPPTERKAWLIGLGAGLLLGLLVLAFMSLSGPGATTAGVLDARVTDTYDLSTGAPGPILEVLDATAPAVHVAVRAQAPPEGLTVDVAWFQGTRLVSSSLLTYPAGEAGWRVATLTPADLPDAPTTWPAGDYRAKILSHPGDDWRAETLDRIVHFNVTSADGWLRDAVVTDAVDPDSLAPTGARTAFAPDTAPLYFVLLTESAPHGKELTIRWIHGDTLDGVSPLTLDEGDGWDGVYYEHFDGSPWPTGAWRADVFEGDRILRSIHFTVEEPTPRETVHEIVVTDAMDPDTHAPTGARDGSFAPTTEKIYASVRYTAPPSGASLKMAWHQGTEPLGEVPLTLAGGAEGWIATAIERPAGGFAVGDYRVDVVLDGMFMGSASFRVEADA